MMSFMHVMLRVRDLEKSVSFYKAGFGMKEIRRDVVEGGRYTLAFMGFGPEQDHTLIELTHNWDQTEPYQIGQAFGHLAFGVPDVASLCEKLTSIGGTVTRGPGPVKFGTTVIAFVEDPDGYKIELIERV